MREHKPSRFPHLNALHVGYHHQPEPRRAANSSRRGAPALPQPSARQIPPRVAAGGKGEALAGAARKSPIPTSPASGSKATRPQRLLGDYGSGLASLGADAQRAGTGGTTFTPCTNAGARAGVGEHKVMGGLSQGMEGLSRGQKV